jgi:uncharacterized protein (TIGR00251 family)
MKMNVKVIPGAKKQGIEKEDNGFKIYLKSKPEKGKANKELITLLADYFNIPKNNVKILKGEFSRNKIIKIGEKR